ncbi:MAG: ABC transporter permease subunit [Verrucomicrobiales bacterium]|nr:ABC transporter permease subunit [Verrucomicrobiales bacterium]
MIPRIVKYVLQDILRSRIALAYTLLMAVASVGLFNLDGGGGKGLVSLLSVVLLVVPLMSLVFATIHFYNSYEFIELLSSQPLRRSSILLGEFFGVSLALCVAFFLGVGVPVLLYEATPTGFCLVGVGLLLTLVFVALAFLGAVCSRDKARGIGVALLMWFYFALIYDGLVLFLLYAFADYPMEKAAIALVSLNPVDLGRVIILLQMDVSALMGYTGAVMLEFFGSTKGILYSVGVLLLWIVLPAALAVRVFRKKDL